ncbi:hypothetical protein ACTWM0_05975 [Pseudomonas machongensis]
MQQHESGATIFHLQVAPGNAFSVKTSFLLLFEANTTLLIRKGSKNDPFRCLASYARRVAPFS